MDGAPVDTLPRSWRWSLRTACSISTHLFGGFVARTSPCRWPLAFKKQSWFQRTRFCRPVARSCLYRLVLFLPHLEDVTRALVKTANGEGHLELRDLPEPAPAADEIKLKIAAAGLCGTDLHIL